jgi:hypothetical protein
MGFFCIGVCVVQMYSLLLRSIYVVAFKCIPKYIVVFYLNYVHGIIYVAICMIFIKNVVCVSNIIFIVSYVSNVFLISDGEAPSGFTDVILITFLTF